MMDMVVPGKIIITIMFISYITVQQQDEVCKRNTQRRGRPRLRWTDNNREDMTKYELTADMTENRQYWNMMVKTGPQRSGDGL